MLILYLNKSIIKVHKMNYIGGGIKFMKKRISVLFMIMVMLLSAVFSTSAVLAEEVYTKYEENALPKIGEELYGFRVTERGRFKAASAETITFEHIKSGATLVYIKNDDKNLAFNIGYRTPQIDESDRNHVFEHAIIAGSDKYPSTNVFFDIANKAYQTYVNASTGMTSTNYMLSSMSEVQLKKMMDVYLSCMVKPIILENENVFKREAINYTLEDKDSEIELGGTVFSEDTGYMTNVDDGSINAVIDSLYPGETASNMIGRAVENYKLLTYEHTKELYDMCYHFDNSIISLYGDLDYKAFLKFIDEEYLSKYERSNTDLSAYKDGKSKSKFVENTVYIPAYEGDTTENASEIVYAIDLSEYELEDIMYLSYICGMLNNSNSVINNKLYKEGISNSFSCYVYLDSQKPFMLFALDNANTDVKDKFMNVLNSSFEEIKENGINKSEYSNILKSFEISNSTAGESIDFAVNTLVELSTYWAVSGRTNYYSLYDDTFEALVNDENQVILKRLADKISDPKNSALVSAVPKPGLAEEIDEERYNYLAEMKANMTDEEIEVMVEDTKAYNEWNNNPVHNNNVSIKPEQLPEPTLYPAAEVKKLGSISSYSSEISKDVGKYSLKFDIGSIKQEDLYYIGLYSLLLGSLDTEGYTEKEISALAPVYLNNLGISVDYLKKKDAESPEPVFDVDWYCVNEDYETSLNIILNILEKSDFNNKNKVVSVLEESLPYINPARTGDPIGMLKEKAKSGFSEDAKFSKFFNGSEYYEFLNGILTKLKEDEKFSAVLSEKLDGITAQIVHKDNLISTVISDEEGIKSSEEINNRVLNKLGSINMTKEEYTLEEQPKSAAYIIDASNQYSVLASSISEDFKGEYIPFINMINDMYTVPVIRFINGAYSAETGFGIEYDSKYIYSYSYADPNVKKTVDVYKNMAQSIADADVTQEILDDYIVASYSNMVMPKGEYTSANLAIDYEIYGLDKMTAKKFADGIKSAKPEDLQDAVNCIQQMVDNGYIVFAGNSSAINADKDVFDIVVDYRGK